jgi:hypothetical protein
VPPSVTQIQGHVRFEFVKVPVSARCSPCKEAIDPLSVDHGDCFRVIQLQTGYRRGDHMKTPNPKDVSAISFSYDKTAGSASLYDNDNNLVDLSDVSLFQHFFKNSTSTQPIDWYIVRVPGTPPLPNPVGRIEIREPSPIPGPVGRFEIRDPNPRPLPGPPGSDAFLLVGTIEPRSDIPNISSTRFGKYDESSSGESIPLARIYGDPTFRPPISWLPDGYELLTVPSGAYESYQGDSFVDFYAVPVGLFSKQE